MKDRDWRALIDNIKFGNCILVLGPDIATGTVGDKFKSLTEILSSKLTEEN